MRKGIQHIIGAFLLLAISSCHKEPPVVTAPSTKGVYITNEGDFNTGQGEISFYDPATQTLTNGLFFNVNGYHLGDVVQSMYIKDSTGFIVVNNSAKIEVVKIPSLQHILTINIAGSSPRYFMPINDNIAYVTDLYAGAIHVINYKTGALITNITGVAKQTEHLLLINNIVVVEERCVTDTCHSGSFITIDPTSNTVLHRYSYSGSSLDGMVADHLKRLWFAMDADTSNGIPSSIYCLNNDMTINRNIIMGTGHIAWNLQINGTGDEIYYLDNNGVNALSINDSVPPATPFIPSNGHNFYGLGVAPLSGDVYVSNVLDYVQKSEVYRYDKNGNPIQLFTAGVISGNFAFSNE